MEENIFASYSFTSPSKSRSPVTGKLNVCESTARAPSASGVDDSRRGRIVKRSKGETFHCSSNLLSDYEQVSSLSSLVGDSAAVGPSRQVKECSDSEALGQFKPVCLMGLQEVIEHELCSSKPLIHNISPPFSTTKKAQSPKFSDNEFTICGDIEDSVPGSPKFWPVPLEKKTTTLSKRGGMNTNSPPSTAAPPGWQDILEEIRKMRVDRDAPVDLLGPEQLVDRSKDAETQKFHILVAAVLSSQTRDATTAAAMKRLHAMPGGFTVQRVAEDDLSVGTLEQLLKPVGFYRQKAKYLKTISTMLLKPPYCGSVPSTLSELLKLPGVGPKIGLLVLSAAFGKSQEGFICDSNIARVCCRLGWVPEDSTPDKTRQALEMWLPKDLWTDLSYLFVGFGQQICKPVGPMCGRCKVSSLCPSAFQKKPKTMKKK